MFELSIKTFKRYSNKLEGAKRNTDNYVIRYSKIVTDINLLWMVQLTVHLFIFIHRRYAVTYRSSLCTKLT